MKKRLFALLVAMLMLLSCFALAACEEPKDPCTEHVDADSNELCDVCGASVPKPETPEELPEEPEREPTYKISFNYHGIIYQDQKDEEGYPIRDDNGRPVRVGVEGDSEFYVIDVLQNEAPTEEQLAEIDAITYEGITVVGWYDTPEFENEVDFEEVLTADKTVYAKLKITESNSKGSFCGDKATWKITSKGVLKIEGEGAMFDFTYPELTPWYFEDDGVTRRRITGIEVGSKITHIGAYSFYNLSIAKSSEIEIGESVTSIGNYAFAYSTLLKEAPLTENIKVIGRGAFEGCKSFTSITIPDSVEEIQGYAFSRCTSFTYLILGKGVKQIDEFAFRHDPDVKDDNSIHEYIYYRGTEEDFANITIQLGNIKFLSYGAYLYYLQDEDPGVAGPFWIYNEAGYPQMLSYTVRYMASGNSFPLLTDYIRIGADGKTGVYTQENVDKLNALVYRGYKFASWGNSNYTNLEKPTPVTGHLSFTGERGTVVGDTATYLYESRYATLTIKGTGRTWDFEGAGDAIYFNKNIATVKFDEGITYLGANLLGGITSLVSIEIPETVTEVHPKLFSGCTNLAAVYYLGDDISKCKGLDSLEFTKAQVFAKGSAESAGKDGSFWSDLVRCDVCNVTGQVNCDKCTASGSITVACAACTAGKITCATCNGNKTVSTACAACTAGKITCATCNGSQSVSVACTDCTEGKSTCAVCNGAGVDCAACATTGTVICATCSGAGSVSVACTACDGEGAIACVTCSGTGSISNACTACAGEGATTCQTCSGVGSTTAVCDACNGTTKVACTSCKVTRLAWSFEDGVLTIGGTNVMADFEVGEAPWLSYTNVKELKFSSNITTIGANAFAGMKGIEKLTLHEKLVNIPRSAFADSDYWKNDANWDNGALMAGEHLLAFDASKVSAPYATIPQSAKVITAEAFLGCESITELVLPSYFKSIDETAFDGLTGLTKIYYYGQTVNDWNKLSAAAREDLSSAKLLYRSGTKPASNPEDYWRNVSRVPTTWDK